MENNQGLFSFSPSSLSSCLSSSLSFLLFTPSPTSPLLPLALRLCCHMKRKRREKKCLCSDFNACRAVCKGLQFTIVTDKVYSPFFLFFSVLYVKNYPEISKSRSGAAPDIPPRGQNVNNISHPESICQHRSCHAFLSVPMPYSTYPQLTTSHFAAKNQT